MTIKKTTLAGAICTIFTHQVQAEPELLLLIEMLHKNGTVDDAQCVRLMDEINTGNKECFKYGGGTQHGEEPSLFQVRGQWAF